MPSSKAYFELTPEMQEQTGFPEQMPISKAIVKTEYEKEQDRGAQLAADFGDAIKEASPEELDELRKGIIKQMQIYGARMFLFRMVAERGGFLDLLDVDLNAKSK